MKIDMKMSYEGEKRPKYEQRQRRKQTLAVFKIKTTLINVAMIHLSLKA